MQANDLTFGVEIECYAPMSANLEAALQAAGVQVSRAVGSIHSVTPGWKVVHDGSLASRINGFIGREVVSPILKGEDGIAQVLKVAAAIEAAGCKVDKSCGLHVHVGAQSATPGQIKNLAKMFLKYEHHFDSLCPESRRNNRFAQSNLAYAAGYTAAQADYPTKIAAAFAKLDECRSVARIAGVVNGGYAQQHYTHYRYFKLNLQSLATHGTVEFRQQAGTVNGQKMVSWIRLVVGMVATAFTLKSVTSQAEPTFAKMLRKVDRPTAAFLKQRRIALNRGAALAE
jgi:hypothetical protein